MATTGNIYAGAAANFASGTTAWTNPTNAIGSSTATAATAAMAKNSTSQQLRLTSYSLNLPLAAIVTNITIGVYKSSTSTDTPDISDNAIYLIDADGNLMGNNMAAVSTNWPNSANATVVEVTGTAADWGINSVDQEIFRQTSFGVSLQAKTGSTSATAAQRTASVRYAYINITYVDGSTMKYYNGSIWAEAVLKRWNGTYWENIPTTILKRWNGSTWV